MSYVPRLAKVVNVLAIRQVKQGPETTGFRIGFTLHSCQYDSSLFNISDLILVGQYKKFMSVKINTNIVLKSINVS